MRGVAGGRRQRLWMNNGKLGSVRHGAVDDIVAATVRLFSRSPPPPLQCWLRRRRRCSVENNFARQYCLSRAFILPFRARRKLLLTTPTSRLLNSDPAVNSPRIRKHARPPAGLAASLARRCPQKSTDGFASFLLPTYRFSYLSVSQRLKGSAYSEERTHAHTSMCLDGCCRCRCRSMLSMNGAFIYCLQEQASTEERKEPGLAPTCRG